MPVYVARLCQKCLTRRVQVFSRHARGSHKTPPMIPLGVLRCQCKGLELAHIMMGDCLQTRQRQGKGCVQYPPCNDIICTGSDSQGELEWQSGSCCHGRPQGTISMLKTGQTLPTFAPRAIVTLSAWPALSVVVQVQLVIAD